jgi:hypothetical protein
MVITGILAGKPVSSIYIARLWSFAPVVLRGRERSGGGRIIREIAIAFEAV